MASVIAFGDMNADSLLAVSPGKQSHIDSIAATRYGTTLNVTSSPIFSAWRVSCAVLRCMCRPSAGLGCRVSSDAIVLCQHLCVLPQPVLAIFSI